MPMWQPPAFIATGIGRLTWREPAALLPPPLWGRVGVGGREVWHIRCPTRRPPPPTPPQPNLAIARVRPLNKAIEVGNSRLRLGEGRRRYFRICAGAGRWR